MNNSHHQKGAAKNPVKAAFRLVQQVWDQPVTVTASDRRNKHCAFSFRYLDIMGNGTFGIVCRARDLATNEIVAIKTVYQDETHQNREPSIIKSLAHDNIVGLKYYFYTRNEHGEEFLSLVLEWMPTSVDKLLKDHQKRPETIPLPLIQRAMQQFALSLGYLHGMGICHRDIKPHNLLIDPTTGMVKLCDFGCSKRLLKGESNIQYICARYYRAPEIVLGWANYSSAVDLWSAGCVLAELFTGLPLFPGKNSIDQLAKISKILGSPTDEEMVAMGQEPKRIGSKAPLTAVERVKVLRTLIPRHIPDVGVDLLAGLLQYTPEDRLKPLAILTHPFLADLKPFPTSSGSLEEAPPMGTFVDATNVRTTAGPAL